MEDSSSGDHHGGQHPSSSSTKSSKGRKRSISSAQELDMTENPIDDDCMVGTESATQHSVGVSLAEHPQQDEEYANELVPLPTSVTILAKNTHSGSTKGKSPPQKANNRTKASKGGKTGKKSVESRTQSWNNIFSTCKLVLSMKPHDMSNNDIMIRFAQSTFYENFGYAPSSEYQQGFSSMMGMGSSSSVCSVGSDVSTASSDSPSLPIPLKNLYGKATVRFSTLKLQNAMLTNKSLCEYINLYNSKGVALSCHVTLTSISGQLSRTSNPDEATTVRTGEKWAILTIRSASVVGNSKLSGVGILGIDRIPIGKLKERLDAHRVNKEKASKTNALPAAVANSSSTAPTSS